MHEREKAGMCKMVLWSGNDHYTEDMNANRLWLLIDCGFLDVALTPIVLVSVSFVYIDLLLGLIKPGHPPS